jgi:hypothetical protein
MHHQVAPFGMRERPHQQPLDERVAIARRKHLIERIGAAAPLRAAGHREQVQIVIAEHDDGVIPECTHLAQRRERPRPAVDEIADEPEPVTVGGELQPCEEGAQLLITTLQIADGIAGHCRMPGIARRNGSIGASNCAPSSASIW